MSLRHRIARLEQQEPRPVRMCAVEHLGDPLPPGVAPAGPDEILIVVATGIRRAYPEEEHAPCPS